MALGEVGAFPPVGAVDDVHLPVFVEIAGGHAFGVELVGELNLSPAGFDGGRVIGAGGDRAQRGERNGEGSLHDVSAPSSGHEIWVTRPVTIPAPYYAATRLAWPK